MGWVDVVGGGDGVRVYLRVGSEETLGVPPKRFVKGL